MPILARDATTFVAKNGLKVNGYTFREAKGHFLNLFSVLGQICF